MKVLILGIDGYIGWALKQHLEGHGHDVYGTDNTLRRVNVSQVKSYSAIPIHSFGNRMNDRVKYADLMCDSIPYAHEDHQFDAIVHLAEQPSAPFSMISQREATRTQSNNVLGTLNLLWEIKSRWPSAHLVKLGTMGEYGTPDVSIPEGCFPEGSSWWRSTGEHDGDEDELVGDLSGMMFPRKAGSWYHLSKVHDTHNIEFACRNWGLRSTDIMQGVVYGSQTNEVVPDKPETRTRFDVDEYFGTVINRFCAQAVLGIPLTVYGEGNQTRGYLPLRDSVQCLRIAIENPPAAGEYRTFNQFAETYSVNYLADMVRKVGEKILGKEVLIHHMNNPRKEMENHRYEVTHQKLFDLGYKPQGSLYEEIELIIKDLYDHKLHLETIPESVILPKTKWS